MRRTGARTSHERDEPLHPRNRRGARETLHELRLRTLVQSGAVQRGRLTALAVSLRLLARLPRITPLASVFARRWHSRLDQTRRAELMCGIVGAVSAPKSTAAGRSGCATVSSPRSGCRGLWASDDGRVCLGHRRLDDHRPSPEANQPFLSADGRSRRAQRRDLQLPRAPRRSWSRSARRSGPARDTEVLLEAYRASVTAASSGSPECSRSRSGTRAPPAASVRATGRARSRSTTPRTGDSFLFASELKSLLLWPGFERTLDGTAVADFLTFGFVPDPKTIWTGRASCRPAHALSVELDDRRPVGVSPAPYWDLVVRAGPPVHDWGAEIREALEAAAAEMAFADVPVGTFLSGGVDSSAVTAALARVGHDVRAFTIGFEDTDYDERPFARARGRTLRRRALDEDRRRR